MTAIVSTVFRLLCFPCEGWIITVDQLSISRPDPSSGASRVPMIDNPQPGIVNLGIRLFPSLMGTFDYPLPANDIRFILVVPDQSKVVIFQVVSFRMSYFNDSWILPSPSASMEGIGHPGMDMPLSAAEVTYSISEQASTNPVSPPPQEIEPIL
jgi:hypothetical protein